MLMPDAPSVSVVVVRIAYGNVTARIQNADPCQLKLPPRLAETLAEATVLFHCAILVAPGTTPPTQLPATFKFVVLFALLICAWAMLAELKIAAQAAASATRFMRVREDARRGIHGVNSE